MAELPVVIVAHGHSMTNSGRGREIDKYPVVRMKQSKRLLNNPEDYGTRTDYAGSTTAVLNSVISAYPDALEYWGYIKSKSMHELKTCDNLYYAEGKPLFMPMAAHMMWLKTFYEMRGRSDVRYSTGTGILICALERFDGEIVLAGFDSIVDPENTHWSSTLATKKYKWETKPPHDFRAEHELLDELKHHYGKRIEVMD